MHERTANGSSDTQQETEAFMSAVATEKESTTDVLASWPDLCQWLAEQGLLVFTSAINPAEQWHWSWKGTTQSGYSDAQAAILAALQAQLQPASCPPRSFAHSLVPLATTKTQEATQQRKKKLF